MTFPLLDPPITTYPINTENAIFNWELAYSRTKIRYLKFSIFANGVVIPNCRVFGGRIYPPQQKFGNKYKSLVFGTRSFCEELYAAISGIIVSEALPIGLDKELDKACSAWFLDSEELRRM